MSEKYLLAADSFGPEEIKAGIEVIQSGRYTMGEKVKEFEKGIAQWVGAEHAVMVNSGSSANLLLVDALIRRSQSDQAPLKPGDEVLVPALSWPTTVWPIVQLGLVPVFVDVDPKTLAISLDEAAKMLTPKTRGMFLIHVLGQACDMKSYRDFCDKHKITLIEDCCESLGAYDGGRHTGLFGYGGTLSHFYSHHLTTMEGGTIITNNAELADDLRSMRAHGWVRDRTDKDVWFDKYNNFDQRFLFILPGYNVRPMEVSAAMGLVQLKRLDSFLTDREKLARHVVDFLKVKVPWLEVVGAETLPNSPTAKRSQRKNSWMTLPMRLKKDAPINVGQVMKILNDNGVENRAIIAGNLVRHPVISHINCRVSREYPVADSCLERGFMIGCHPMVAQKQLGVLENAFSKLSQA